MASTLIRGKYVISKVTGPDSAAVFSDGAVFQRDGEIVAVGTYDDLKDRYQADEVIGSPNYVVMPGLVNDHFHVGLTPFQLGAPSLPLELWGLSRMRAKDVDPYLDPDVSIVDAVVHRGRSIDVDTVIIDGEVVMRGRKLTRVDEGSLLSEIRKSMNRAPMPHELERRDLAEKVEPYLRKFFEGTMNPSDRPHYYYNSRS